MSLLLEALKRAEKAKRGATLALKAVRIPKETQAQAKLNYIENLGLEKVVAIGNGANDAEMLKNAGLGIVVIGPEGAAVKALMGADIAVGDIRDALCLLIYPKRMVATLRR